MRDVLRPCATNTPWPPAPANPVQLTAVDDCGGWYVGLPDAHAPEGDPAWHLFPSLDPEAGELTLTHTGPTESASVRVPLS